jgi:RHS repeat-associated protein
MFGLKLEQLRSAGRKLLKCLAKTTAALTIASAAIPSCWAAPPTLVAQPVVAAPHSIPELARALKYDALLIYEFVYTNIEYEPFSGSAKGALGTLIDGRGNDFDQASLMVALLRESGYTAGFRYGLMELTAAEASNWLGTTLYQRCPVQSVLSSGGYEYHTLPPPSGDCALQSISGVTIKHVWVAASGGSFGSTTYYFDPSFKTYNIATGIDLGAKMHYDQGELLAAAEAGSTIGASSVQNLNRAALASKLTGYANDLITEIKTNSPTATTRDIIGGRYIQPLAQPITLSTTIPRLSSGETVAEWTDIPDEFRVTLRVQIGGIDVLRFADQIYVHRLSIIYDGSARPVLYLDGESQGTGSAGAAAITFTIGFPFYAFSRQTNLSVAAGYTYAVVHGFGGTGSGMVEYRRRQMQAAQANGGSATSEAVLGESLNMIGASWLAQNTASYDLHDRIVGSKQLALAWGGVVGQTSAPYIDMPAGLVAVSKLSNGSTAAATAFMTASGIGSALEWGAMEQSLFLAGTGAVSTVKLFDIANSQGTIVFDASASNWSTISPQLTGYSSGTLSNIQGLLNLGYRVVLPKSGSLTQGSWTGSSYLAIGPPNSSGTPSFIGWFISPHIFGGNSTQTTTPAQVVPSVKAAVDTPREPAQKVGYDPVDLFSGAFLYDHDDLSIGPAAAPAGLTFSRSYNSNDIYQTGAMGPGWTHGFSLSAKTNSDGFRGMGRDSPIDAAAMIAAAFVSKDLLSDPSRPLENVVIATLIQRWAMDRMINNSVNVTMGAQAEQFMLLVDGTYNPRPGSSSRLTQGGGLYTFLTKEGAILNFNSSGLIASGVDTNNNTISFTYDAATPPKPTLISNNFGRSLTLAYDGSGRLTTVSDNGSPSRSISYAYDGKGNLASYTDPNGAVTAFTYVSIDGVQPPALLAQVFYPSSPSIPFVTNTYDTLGRVAVQNNALGATWNYYFAGYRSEEDDPYGTQRVLFYTPRGKPLFEIQDSAGQALTTTTTYDGLDRPITMTLPEGGQTVRTYDATTNPWANNVAQIERKPKPGAPLALLITTYTYEAAFNKPLTVTDPRGLVTAMSYDGATGNLLTVIADRGGFAATTRYTYNTAGQPLTITDPIGTVTQYTYDAAGNRLTAVADAGAGRLNRTTSFAYDSRGDPLTVTDPRGNVTTFTYDDKRRPLTTTTPPTASAGLVTASTYDPDGRVVQVRQSSAGTILRTTSATYTPSGKTATATDANGNVTRFAYDLLDRLVSTFGPMGRTTSFTWTVLSQPYRTYNTAIQAGPLLEQTWTDDGLRASLKDAAGNTTSFTYDRFDRLVTTTYPGGTTETAAYDADGNVTRRCTRAGQPIGYTWDTLNRLSSKTLPGAAATCGATPAGTVVSYRYDPAGRLTAVSDTGASIPSVAMPGSTTTYTTAYTYDARNRVTGVAFDPVTAATTPSTSSSVTFTHGYNAANQRSSLAVTDNAWIDYPAASASTTCYTANSLNQYSGLRTTTASTCTGGTTASPAYDTNGNLTDDGSTYKFEYDAENRLTKSKTSGGSTIGTYTFDGRGRRTSKTVSGTTTVYVTDADNREVLEYDGSSGAIQRWYPYGLGPNAVLGQINVASGTRSTPVPDLRGSIIGSMDAGSGTLTSFGYKPYGASASAPSRFGYTGQRVDAEDGLYYYRARHYSPGWGRFLQADPIRQAGASNLYMYVENDPLGLVDPLGLWTLQVGVSFYVNLSWISGGFSVGIVADSSGNAGTYQTIGVGPSVGGGLKLALNSAVSSAPTITDLRQWGAGTSVFLGAGLAGSVDWSKGWVSRYEPYNSWGGSLGVGLGGGASAGPSYTFVQPLIMWDGDPSSDNLGVSSGQPNSPLNPPSNSISTSVSAESNAPRKPPKP